MKIKKICLLFISVLVLFVCFWFNGFKSFASSSHYDLTLEDNALIFTFPDYHGSFSKSFIEINGSEIVSRLDNSLLINNELGVLDIYKYIWAWYFDFSVIGSDDYLVRMSVYNLLATDYITQNFNFVGSYEIPIPTTDVLLSVDYDSTLETFVNFDFESSKIKDYLEYNGLQPGYSALGVLLDTYYHSGYDNGFIDGTSSFENIPLTFITPILSFFSTFFAIELAPGLTIGYLVLIPLVFGVIGLILYFWRKD